MMRLLLLLYWTCFRQCVFFYDVRFFEFLLIILNEIKWWTKPKDRLRKCVAENSFSYFEMETLDCTSIMMHRLAHSYAASTKHTCAELTCAKITYAEPIWAELIWAELSYQNYHKLSWLESNAHVPSATPSQRYFPNVFYFCYHGYYFEGFL